MPVIIREHPHYVDTSQAAAILGTTPAQVRAMIRRGEFSVDRPARWYVLSRAEVEAKAREDAAQ